MKQIPLFENFPVMLAPMAGISERPFRVLCKRMGCDLVFTEMISAKGLVFENAKTEQLLRTAEEERPVAVQLFGSEPPVMAAAAKIVEERYAEAVALIDINMGCPAHKIISNGEGSALMKNLPLAAKVIEAVVRATSLPVTVKFRKGWDAGSVNAVEFAKMAEESGAAAVSVHGRTREQGYSGKADWDIIADVKRNMRIPVWGNGDLFSAEDVLAMREKTGCDGVMVARGALGNPFLFREIRAALDGGACVAATMREKIELAAVHANMQQEMSGGHGAVEMRKHIAWYSKGMPGAAALRARVNEAGTVAELTALLEELAVF